MKFLIVPGSLLFLTATAQAASPTLAQYQAAAEAVRASIVSQTVAAMGTSVDKFGSAKANPDESLGGDPDGSSLSMTGSKTTLSTKDGRTCQISIHDAVVPFASGNEGAESNAAGEKAVAASLPAFQRIAPADFYAKLAAVTKANGFTAFFNPMKTPEMIFDELRLDEDGKHEFNSWNISVQCFKGAKKSTAAFSAASFDTKTFVYAASADLEAVEADDFTPDAPYVPAPPPPPVPEHQDDWRQSHDDQGQRPDDRDHHDQQRPSAPAPAAPAPRAAPAAPEHHEAPAGDHPGGAPDHGGHR